MQDPSNPVARAIEIPSTLSMSHAENRESSIAGRASTAFSTEIENRSLQAEARPSGVSFCAGRQLVVPAGRPARRAMSHDVARRAGAHSLAGNSNACASSRAGSDIESSFGPLPLGEREGSGGGPRSPGNHRGRTGPFELGGREGRSGGPEAHDFVSTRGGAGSPPEGGGEGSTRDPAPTRRLRFRATRRARRTS